MASCLYWVRFLSCWWIKPNFLHSPLVLPLQANLQRSSSHSNFGSNSTLLKKKKVLCSHHFLTFLFCPSKQSNSEILSLRAEQNGATGPTLAGGGKSSIRNLNFSAASNLNGHVHLEIPSGCLYCWHHSPERGEGLRFDFPVLWHARLELLLCKHRLGMICWSAFSL